MAFWLSYVQSYSNTLPHIFNPPLALFYSKLIKISVSLNFSMQCVSIRDIFSAFQYYNEGFTFKAQVNLYLYKDITGNRELGMLHLRQNVQVV